MNPAHSSEGQGLLLGVSENIVSIIKELANENLLYMALQGCRAVLERELGIKSVIFSMADRVRQEMIRRARESQNLEFPYAFLTLSALSAVRDRQNNYAVKKHGTRYQTVGQRATTTKGYTFPITLGLDFHYIDSDANRLLVMAQSLVLLSATDGLTFQIDVGEIMSFAVTMEIPLETTINMSESNSAELPGATDLTVQMIMHTTVGFFRDVSAVKGDTPTMQISVSGAEPFNVGIPLP